jgi:hypothetical protein
MEKIRRVALELCNPGDRGGVRFVGPKKRKHSEKITIENLESVDLGELCTRVRPAVVFLRQTTGADLSCGSRLDIYVPTGVSAYADLASRLLLGLSVASLAAAASIMKA